MIKKIVGIILNSIDYKENHKISYILTDTGKISALIPRAKRFKEGLIADTQSLNLIEFEIDDLKSLSKAKNINVIDFFNEIKNDLKKYSAASYALEVIYRMVEAEINPSLLFKLLNEFLKELKVRDDIKLLLLQFRIKMLYFLGIQPNFKECIHCGSRTDLAGLSIKYGSMECVMHQSSDNIGMDATNIIKLLYLDKTLQIKIDDDNVISYISDIIDSYYESHQYYGLKSVKMLKELKCY